LFHSDNVITRYSGSTCSPNTYPTMYFSILVAFCAITSQAHLQEIVFLVDNSHPIDNEQECMDRQEGIGNYFQAFHDLNPGNVLSYILFNHQTSSRIIDFIDNNTMDFNAMVNKIKNLPCNSYDDDDNNSYDVLDALKYSVSLFSESPHNILLFNMFKGTNNEHKICNYFKNQRDVISISQVNFLGYGLSENHLNCLAEGSNDTKSSFFEFNGVSRNEFSLYHQQVIESIAGPLPQGTRRHLQSSSSSSDDSDEDTTTTTSTTTTSTTTSTTTTTTESDAAAMFVENNVDGLEQNMLNNHDDSLSKLLWSQNSVWNIITIAMVVTTANLCFLCGWVSAKKHQQLNYQAVSKSIDSV